MAKELSTMRRCPGVGENSCGSFMASVTRDPHPTCTRCRGQTCTRQLTCEVCAAWSEEQWTDFEKIKKKKKKPKSVAGGSTPSATSTAPQTLPPDQSTVTDYFRAERPSAFTAYCTSVSLGTGVGVLGGGAPVSLPSGDVTGEGSSTTSVGEEASTAIQGTPGGSVPALLAGPSGSPARSIDARSAVSLAPSDSISVAASAVAETEGRGGGSPAPSQALGSEEGGRDPAQGGPVSVGAACACAAYPTGSARLDTSVCVSWVLGACLWYDLSDARRVLTLVFGAT